MTDDARESRRRTRKQNAFCEFAVCKHCGKDIGHRPHTRSWEHKFSNPDECDYPFPKKPFGDSIISKEHAEAMKSMFTKTLNMDKSTSTNSDGGFTFNV